MSSSTDNHSPRARTVHAVTPRRKREAEQAAAEARRRALVGRAHAYGACVVAFTPSIVIDAAGLFWGDTPMGGLVSALVGLVCVLSTWVWLAALTPWQPHARWRFWATLAGYTLLAAGTVACALFYAPGFDVLRSSASTLLVLRLVYTRGQTWRDLSRWTVTGWRIPVRAAGMVAVSLLGVWASVCVEAVLRLLPGLRASLDPAAGVSLLHYVELVLQG